MINQHPDEWYELRRTGIGGSDAAAVLGESKWKTPYKVWREKVFGERDPDNKSFQAGRRLEPIIREWYEDETGQKVVIPGFMRDKHYKFLCGNVDGLTDDKVIEIKTARFNDWGDTPPNAYVLQCQHYLLLTGKDSADLVVLFAGQDFKVYSIDANPDLQRSMLSLYKIFWNCVETKTPPPARTLDDIKAMFPMSVANTKTLSRNAIAGCKTINEMKKQIASLQSDIDEIELDIKNELQDSDTGIDSDGRVICTWKTSKPRMTVDTEGLKKAGLYDQFLKPGKPNRTFLLKEVKE